MTTVVYAFNDKKQVEMLFEMKKTSLLVSYFYLKQKKQKMVDLLEYIKSERNKYETPGCFMLDSGAYSAWRSGSKIKLFEYIDYIKTYHSYFTHIVCLDVIDNPIYSEVNHLIMLEELKDFDLEIIPVFHAGESMAVLDYMVLKGYKYIGISPNNNWPEKSKRKWLHRVYSRHDFEKLGIKTHGFGYQSTDGLLQFPMTTADAITWKIAAGYGRIIDPVNPSVRYSERGINFSDHIDNIAGGHSDFTIEMSAKLGISPDELKASDGEGHKIRSKYNIEAIESLVSRPKRKLAVSLDLFDNDPTSMGYCEEEFTLQRLEEVLAAAKIMGRNYEGDSINET